MTALLCNKRQTPFTENIESKTNAADRFAEMQAMQKAVRPYINSDGLFLLHTRLYAKDEKEQSKASVRAFYIAKIFQYITEPNLPWLHNLQNEQMMRIAAVGEYCITILYLENHYHDGKFGVIDEASKKKNREELRQTHEALSHYIQREFRGRVQEKVEQAVQQLFKRYQMGLLLDKNTLTYDNFIRDNPDNLHRVSRELDTYVNVDSFLSMIQQYRPQKYTPFEQENYLRLLLTRAFLINAVFFQGFTELLIDLYAFPSRDHTRLIQFSRIYGMAQQLVNDNCDYAPISYKLSGVCKRPEDTFSDMKRRLVTLPMMVLFSKPQTAAPGFIEHYNNSTVLNIDAYETSDADAEQKRLLKLLKQSGVMAYAIGVLNGLAQPGEKLIPELKYMYSFVRGNRYYKTYTSK